MLKSLLVTAVFATFPVWGQDHHPDPNQLPDLGQHSSLVLSAVEEEYLGREFIREIRRQTRFIDDPQLLDYLDRLGNRIARHAGDSNQGFHFYLIANPELNAFAVPGGHIAFHTGLVETTQNEDELAAVMAHEVAHVTQHHLARILEKAKQTSLPALAGLVAAILLGGQAGTAALAITNASLLSRQLRYSRGFEREADAIGIRTLGKAGYQTSAMPGFFERMLVSNATHDSDAPEFLRTHPLTTNRIAESRARAASLPTIGKHSSPDYWHFKARIQALYSVDPHHQQRAFRALLNDQPQHPQRSAWQYGNALVSARIGQLAPARHQIAALLGEHPASIRYQLAAADIDRESGQLDAATTQLQHVHRAHPQNRLVQRLYAEALIQGKRYRQARPIIRQLIRAEPGRADIHGLLARIEGGLGKQAATHQALAEQFFHQGLYQPALAQLEQAKRRARKGDDYTLATIAARTVTIQRHADHDKKLEQAFKLQAIGWSQENHN